MKAGLRFVLAWPFLTFAISPGAGVAQTQYASSVTSFSSQYSSTSWSAAQATGSPNTYPTYGDVSTAWASVTADDQREFLEFQFSFPIAITTVSIYETYNPGAVDTIYVKNPSNGLWIKVWEGTAEAQPPSARIFTANFPLTAFNVDQVRLAINSPAVSGWNEIDAVAIVNNTDAAKYHGASGDGHSFSGSVSLNLGGLQLSMAKFHGALYDGHALSGNQLSALNGQTSSVTKHMGGNYDGFVAAALAMSSFNGDSPPSADAVKFHGGSHDGSSGFTAGIAGLNGAIQAVSKYLGGSADGSAIRVVVLSGLNGDAPPTSSATKYRGGTQDGFSNGVTVIASLAGLHPSASKFEGGMADGSDEFSSDLFSLNGDVPPSVSGLKFRGGMGDGHFVIVTYLTAMNGVEPVGNKFYGGSYDGYAGKAADALTLAGNSPPQPDPDKYIGGIADGSSATLFSFGDFSGSAPSTAKFLGASHDGYVMVFSGFSFIGGQPPPSINLTKYHGGGDDGYSARATEFDISLPVELSSFRVSSSFGSIVLNWRTESESDNAYWLVMRRTTTESEKTVATIIGQGTKARGTDYEWIDGDVTMDTTYYYRLADVSYDGHILYHSEQTIRIDRPSEARLFGNFPNPFNPETAIRFSLPYDANIKLKIYNALGQQVRTLEERSLTAGYHTIKWNGRNDRGSAVASGVYLYRLVIRYSTNRDRWTVRTGKMTYLR